MKTDTMKTDSESINQVAQVFIAKLKAWNEPADWERICGGLVDANDVCDANHFMIEAFQRVFGREPRFASDVDEGFCTMKDVYADGDFLELAWDRAIELWSKEAATA